MRKYLYTAKEQRRLDMRDAWKEGFKEGFVEELKKRIFSRSCNV